MTSSYDSSCFHALSEPKVLAPKIFPNPFLKVPHAIAKQAADLLMNSLKSHPQGLGNKEDRGGKMFGVLVVEKNNGQLGWLQGFSGQLDHKWHHDGFVPPLFDTEQRNRFWPKGEESIVLLGKEVTLVKQRLTHLKEKYNEWLMAENAKKTRFDALQKKNRDIRQELREHGCDPHTLNDQSKEDSRFKREFKTTYKNEDDTWRANIDSIREKLSKKKNEQRELSNKNLKKLYGGYQIFSPHGSSRSLLEFGDSKQVPGGTGDCAGAKLIGYANRHKLKPIALAEFWWGAPPKAGGRWHGEFYPSCKGKCGLLLPYLLEGLKQTPPPSYNTDVGPSFVPTILFNDPYYLIADKPSGVLSVPGKGPNNKTSFLSLLNGNKQAGGNLLPVHRLDQATSGLIVFAKNKDAQRAIARLFNFNEIHKEYTAIVKTCPKATDGTIQLPIGPDWPNRPRQIVDKTKGKSAETIYQIIKSSEHSSRIKLVPKTGRTHQLRVHCSHPEGLACPIVGDRLYGKIDGTETSRLLLHASRLVFKHPFSKQHLHITSAPPF